jgi:hypothetical protein
VRVVRLTDSTIEVDSSGKKPGRGVYLCPRKECWQLGLKGGRLARALRADITEESRKRLVEFGESLGNDK